MMLSRLNRWVVLLTVLFAPVLAYAQATSEAPARRWDASWLGVLIAAIVLVMLFSSAKRRGTPPTARRPRL